MAALFPTAAATRLETEFQHPPAAARPWVYWFWLNGNITREGITADLEAMQRVGIGGALIMEVDQGAPVGPIGFMSPAWRALFRHAVVEARRLGLAINLNNDAGWNGSGGPWIKPEHSMQKVVWTEVDVTGPRRFETILPQPQAVAGYYRDIAVLAFPTPGSYRIDNLKVKAGYEVATAGTPGTGDVPAEMTIARERIVDLTQALRADGRVEWEAPAGRWTVMRFGHTSTGVENAPAPASGRGLECDKLSQEGIEANFAGMMGPLIADVGRDAGRTLVATHIDSWENGAQNWTARMREEFRQRRGYELQPFLPVLSGRVVGSLEVAERFLWDLRQTISDLVVENYAGHLRTLAARHGMRLSIEAYGGPCDDLPYAGRADEPMCEFWIGGGALNTIKGMASAAHIYGRPILGAEAFTAADQEKWLEHPASIKALGDRAFCDGVNRMVFHRYALQPWADRRPGMTMGPWGLHYERTQTWWEWSRPWHDYLARCQFLLRQGLFVADLCFLNPEAAPQDFPAHDPQGYDYDHCSAEVVLSRMTVKDGRLVLPDGMSYRLLVLPDTPAMTPALVRRIKELVEAGATILGSRPSRSPSLAGYPQCDEEVQRLAEALWGKAGDSGGETARGEAGRTASQPRPPASNAAQATSLPRPSPSVPQRHVGAGHVLWGVTPEQALADLGVRPDFASRPRLRAIHRRAGDTDIYFVANAKPHAVEGLATFRVTGKRPELWWPDTGRVESAVAWQERDSTTTVPLRFAPAGSVFVVFRRSSRAVDPVVAWSRDGKSLWPEAARPGLVVEKAVYGVLEDPARTREVTALVQQIVDSGEESFKVSELAQQGDPAQGAVKTVRIEYRVGDRRITVSGRDPDQVYLPEYAPPIEIRKAVYGVLDDSARTRDVRAKLQRLVDAGRRSFSVAEMAAGDDPAFLVVKTLVVDYTRAGEPLTARGTDPETIVLAEPPVVPMPRLATLAATASGQPAVQAWQPGAFELTTASGRTRRVTMPALPPPLELTGPWEVRFEAGWGAPSRTTFDQLVDWSKHRDAGIRYFSGVATYRKEFSLEGARAGDARTGRLELDLGQVAVMARVRLNGRDLGTVWKPPYRLDITKVARRGRNTLEVGVVNLWPNRLIGDEQLPEDSERNPDGTLKAWPAWVTEGKPSPSGRFTFTSWRLWKKADRLQESGLLGPVTIESSQQTAVWSHAKIPAAGLNAGGKFKDIETDESARRADLARTSKPEQVATADPDTNSAKAE